MITNIFRGITLFLLLAFTGKAHAQVFTDPDQAFAAAAGSDKQVLLVFQGSDWCIPCIQLEQKVLSGERFLQFVKDSLVVLKADFPQRKKIDPALVSQYEKLAEAFNPEGSFPKAILLNAQRKRIAQITIKNPAPETFIAAIKELVRVYAAKM
jgi:thiol-disulfide isomerase/thioredoxin